MTDSEYLIHNTARRFYGVHQAQHLIADTDRLIDRCAQRLVETYDLSLDDAKRIAREIHAEPGALTG